MSANDDETIEEHFLWLVVRDRAQKLATWLRTNCAGDLAHADIRAALINSANGDVALEGIDRAAMAHALPRMAKDAATRKVLRAPNPLPVRSPGEQLRALIGRAVPHACAWLITVACPRPACRAGAKRKRRTGSSASPSAGASVDSDDCFEALPPRTHGPRLPARSSEGRPPKAGGASVAGRATARAVPGAAVEQVPPAPVKVAGKAPAPAGGAEELQRQAEGLASR